MAQTHSARKPTFRHVVTRAANSGRNATDVLRWVEDFDGTKLVVTELLAELGDPDAISAWKATCQLPADTRGGVGISVPA